MKEKELGLVTEVVDAEVRRRTIDRCRKQKLLLPTFAELAEPNRIPAEISASLDGVDPDAPDPRNLFRVHWYNGVDRRGRQDVPAHIVLPPELTGIPAPVVVALGNRFPMIHAHKVLAAYACLAPRLVTGGFDPTAHLAVWPSTGNYCRGGVAISRLMGCRGIAVLPEFMSSERFRWLEKWVTEQQDIHRTTGCESNVKEIYDHCAELRKDPRNVILNQFAEFGNYLAHYECTGRAFEKIHESLAAGRKGLRVAAFVSATGSAGTIAAGDRLRENHGAKTVAVEARECPTLLWNGFGDHNIQGIGDKHVPLIHNIMETDVLVGVSDAATDQLLVLFNSDEGRRYLETRRGVPGGLVAALSNLGISSICNVLASISVAKHFDFGPDDLVMTVATDGSAMYGSEIDKAMSKYFPAGFDAVSAGESFGRWVLGADSGALLDLDHRDRNRVFNLGYFTWVEQQGLPLELFEARRKHSFWTDLRKLLPIWDRLIDDFNAEVRG
jgi:cysteine synthase